MHYRFQANQHILTQPFRRNRWHIVSSISCIMPANGNSSSPIECVCVKESDCTKWICNWCIYELCIMRTGWLFFGGWWWGTPCDKAIKYSLNKWDIKTWNIRITALPTESVICILDIVWCIHWPGRPTKGVRVTRWMRKSERKRHNRIIHLRNENGISFVILCMLYNDYDGQHYLSTRIGIETIRKSAQCTNQTPYPFFYHSCLVSPGFHQSRTQRNCNCEMHFVSLVYSLVFVIVWYLSFVISMKYRNQIAKRGWGCHVLFVWICGVYEGGEERIH